MICNIVGINPGNTSMDFFQLDTERVCTRNYLLENMRII